MRLRWLALLLAGCRALPVTPQPLLDALATKPGAHLVGAPAALGPSRVLNAEDFVWDARPSPDATRVAFARLGMKSYFLSLHSLQSGARLADVAVNPYEFDVEALDFSPDGRVVATVSRDGAVRVFDAGDGKLKATWLTDEPLVSLAWSASGEWLALGSAKGLLTVVSWPALAVVAEVRAHADEVRGLAFTPRGTLLSGSWDRRVSTWRLEATAPDDFTVRAHADRRAGLALLRLVVDGRATAAFVLDARVPYVVVRSSLAEAAGVDPLSLTETVTIPGPLGAQVAKVARARRLGLKGLVFEQVDLAVCDACVPAEAQGVIGAALLEQLEVAFDGATEEAIVTARASAKVSRPGAQRFALVRSFSFPAAVNDLSLDATGTTMGLAFSVTRAQRTREVYEREKRGEVEPEREDDCGARVDVESGEVLEKRHGHRGVVSTAGISPDGKTLATGGWDKRVLVHAGAQPLVDDRFGWAVRRVRFSKDGRWLVVAAWTPGNPLGDHQSNPAAVVTELIYLDARISP